LRERIGILSRYSIPFQGPRREVMMEELTLFSPQAPAPFNIRE
jgi:hypothetical protein